MHPSICAAFAPDLFADKVVLVSGGTSGIGLGAALAFQALGASVIATGATEAERVAAGAANPLPRLEFKVLDVRAPDAISGAMAALPRLDVLVNAAGLIRRDQEHDPDVFEQVIAVNLTGSMRMLAAAREKLAETGGSAVNVASMLTFFGGARVPGYSASKGGIGQLTKSLASAWAAHGVRVNAVAPGWIETPLTRDLVNDPDRSRPILSRTPMGRWGQPDDVAGAILFLASPAARFITGAILPVDGGYLTV